MVKFKKSYLVAGVVLAGTCAVGAYIVKKRIEEKRRRNRRVIPDDMRELMVELVKLQVEDYVPKVLPSGTLGKSAFIRLIEKLPDKQLMAIFAIVQVGYFMKASGIEPVTATHEQVKQVVNKYRSEVASAPTNRAALLGELDSTDVFDALRRAYKVLISAVDQGA